MHPIHHYISMVSVSPSRYHFFFAKIQLYFCLPYFYLPADVGRWMYVFGISSNIYIILIKEYYSTQRCISLGK